MSLLIQLTIILAFALVLVPLTKRLGLPTLIGYVFTGIALGPFSFDLIPMSFELKQLQYLGLLLLLFLLGMQLQTERLLAFTARDIKQPSYAILMITLALSTIGMLGLGLNLVVSLIVSAALSLVSFSLLQQQIKRPHGLSTALGQQLFNFGLVHSLWAVLFIASLPILVGFDSPQHSLAYVMSIVAAISGLFLLQRYVLQPVFEFLEKTQTHELVLASAVFTASLSFIALDTLGIHDTLAALLAGFLISNSCTQSRIAHYSAPFKGLVFAAFFIVLGMSLPLHLLLEHPLFLGVGLVSLLLIKICIYLALSRYFKASWQDSVLISSSLMSGGEFGFILLYSAFESQIASAVVLEPYLLILVLSFLISPFILLATQRYVLPRLKNDAQIEDPIAATSPLLIIGFGRVGQLVARVAHLHQIEFTALDNNLQQQPNLAAYGGRLLPLDATDADALQQLPLNSVQLTVVAIDDVEDNINVVRYLQLHYPEIALLVRARDRHHAHLLRDLGVEHIWRETYLSALDLAAQSLTHFGISATAAQASIAQFRIHDQTLQRQQQQIEYDDIKLYQTQEIALDELLYLFDRDRALQLEALDAKTDDLSADINLQQMKANDL